MFIQRLATTCIYTCIETLFGSSAPFNQPPPPPPPIYGHQTLPPVQFHQNVRAPKGIATPPHIDVRHFLQYSFTKMSERLGALETRNFWTSLGTSDWEAGPALSIDGRGCSKLVVTWESRLIDQEAWLNFTSILVKLSIQTTLNKYSLSLSLSLSEVLCSYIYGAGKGRSRSCDGLTKGWS